MMFVFTDKNGHRMMKKTGLPLNGRVNPCDGCVYFDAETRTERCDAALDGLGIDCGATAIFEPYVRTMQTREERMER